MSTYSPLVFACADFEKLFKALAIIFGILTIVCIILAASFAQYVDLTLSMVSENYKTVELAAQIYFYIPAVISFVLTIASLVAKRIVMDLCVALPLEENK